MTENRQSAHGGKPGNKNGAKGPRVGRKDKTTKPLPLRNRLTRAVFAAIYGDLRVRKRLPRHP